MDLQDVGAFVESEIHGMCSWLGETMSVWAKFDCDPATVPLGHLRAHLVEALPAVGDKPEGFIRATAFQLDPIKAARIRADNDRAAAERRKTWPSEIAKAANGSN